MIQALPRYCPRCSAPTRADMQRCAVCDLSVQALLQRGESQTTATTDTTDALDSALSWALAPTPRRFQPLDEDPLPVFQAGDQSSDALDSLPRFPPASPLPPTPAGQPHTPGAPLRLPSSSPLQGLCVFPGSPLPAEPPQNFTLPASSGEVLSVEEPQDPVLPATSDQLPVLSVDAQPDCAEARQPEISASRATAFQSTPAPTPRLFQQEDEKPLPDRQQAHAVPGEFVQPSPVSLTSPLPPEHSKRNERGNRWLAGVILIALLALLIFAGGSGYLVVSSYLSNGDNSQATPSATRITNAVDGQATATTRAENANPYVSGGKLIFSDTLQTAHSNWDQNTDCNFKDGSYHVTATTIQSCTLNTNVTLTNFVLEVKATLLQGNVGGFFFRENKLHDRSNAYLLDFDSKGGYQLWNYSVSDPAQLIDYGNSSNLKRGYNQTNVIAMVVQGPSMTLYVNGQMVKRFMDPTYTNGGLSLISSEYAPQTGISEVAYSDLRLWQL